jgi:hypothetical protein
MKKYRQTRITVKTREIISFSRNAVSETADNLNNFVCPLCQSPVLTTPSAALLKTDYDDAANGEAKHDCPQ